MRSRNTRLLIAVVFLLLIATVAVKEGWRIPGVAPKPAPVVTPIAPPLPVTPVAPPAQPPETAVKPAPLSPHLTPKPPAAKKKAPPKKVAQKAITLPPPVPGPALAPWPTLVTPRPAPPPPPPQEWYGADTSITHGGQVLVKTEEEWDRFWQEHHPHEVSPDVDFTRNMVVGVFSGSRPASEFSIRVVGVRTVAGTLVVDYHEQPPPPGTFAINVTAYPYDIKVIPLSRLPVKFNLLVSQ